MNGKITVVADDKQGIWVEFAEPVKFKMQDQVVVNEAKKIRTLPQNATYWLYLTWTISPFGGDLQSQGHFSKDGLHEDIKAWIKEKHPQDFKIDKKFTTTTLTRQEFSRFFDIVNQELMIEFFGVDTSPFWRDLERFSGWQETNPGTMDDYLRERVPF